MKKKRNYERDKDLDDEPLVWEEAEFGEETKEQKRFRKDMEEAGYKVRLYRGRYFYRGYAAEVHKDKLQDAIRATKVKIQWDNLGLGWIVYPR